MNKKLVLASHNKGKIAELAQLLKNGGYEVVGLEAFPEIGEIEENGASFAENALLKARAVCSFTGLPSLADDSGICVDFLGGGPGIFSARYGDDWNSLPGESRDQRNIRKLLHSLAGVPPEKRQCKFVTVMAAVRPDGRELVTRGEWSGRLLERPCGENGFGYDPVFFDPVLGKSASCLDQEEKNAHSHRGKALAALLKELPQFLA